MIIIKLVLLVLSIHFLLMYMHHIRHLDRKTHNEVIWTISVLWASTIIVFLYL